MQFPGFPAGPGHAIMARLDLDSMPSCEQAMDFGGIFLDVVAKASPTQGW